MPHRILFVFGTRPEALKLAPVIREMEGRAEFEPVVCVTGQHRQMLDQVLDIFGIEPAFDLKLMRPRQGLPEVVAGTLTETAEVIGRVEPDAVVVQGDTASTMAASIAAYFGKVPLVHVEAGLRTYDKYSPFPEEICRRVADVVADLYLAPTDTARDQLLREGFPAERIHVTGNTVIDALLGTWEEVGRPARNAALETRFQRELGFSPSIERFLLITGHRRESFGEGFREICEAVLRLARAFPKLRIVYPVHLNPQVRDAVFPLLSPAGNVRLIEPLAYDEFVWLMGRCHFVLTDSGGVQEEAPSLDRPVLVMREHTEREEAVQAGAALRTGVRADAIFEAAARLLEDESLHARMAAAKNPFGDGRASERTADAIDGFLSVSEVS